MINGGAMILVLVICGIIAYCAFSVGYERGKEDGYNEGWADVKSSNFD